MVVIVPGSPSPMGTSMAKGVFIFRPDSVYEDVPSEQYQFPANYLSRAQQCVGDWIVYLEPTKVRYSKGYFAIAKVQAIIPDPTMQNMFIAIIENGTYLEFGSAVPFRGPLGLPERSVLNEVGKVSGRAQSAVRVIPPADFDRIIDLGLRSNAPLLPRVDDISTAEVLSEPDALPYFASERDRSEYLGSRIVRDRNFRRIVLTAYDERCAITSLKLINGGGRAEVEAAHIQPVENNGPDILTNGIALSGTAHWMFDRGLISIDNDLRILVSRQTNDPSAIYSVINKTGYLNRPKREADKPHPRFLAWHRENQFKY